MEFQYNAFALLGGGEVIVFESQVFLLPPDSMDAEQGSLTLTGGNATFGLSLSVQKGSLVLTGRNATMGVEDNGLMNPQVSQVQGYGTPMSIMSGGAVIVFGENLDEVDGPESVGGGGGIMSIILRRRRRMIHIIPWLAPILWMMI